MFPTPCRKQLLAHGGYRELRVKGALQLLINRYGSIRLAQVPERVLTKSFVVLIIGNSKSFHLGAQGTFNPNPHVRAAACVGLPPSLGLTLPPVTVQRVKAYISIYMSIYIYLSIYLSIHIYIYIYIYIYL